MQWTRPIKKTRPTAALAQEKRRPEMRRIPDPPGAAAAATAALAAAPPWTLRPSAGPRDLRIFSRD